MTLQDLNGKHLPNLSLGSPTDAPRRGSEALRPSLGRPGTLRAAKMKDLTWVLHGFYYIVVGFHYIVVGCFKMFQIYGGFLKWGYPPTNGCLVLENLSRNE